MRGNSIYLVKMQGKKKKPACTPTVRKRNQRRATGRGASQQAP